MTNEGLYDIVHMKGEDIEIAFTHTNQYGEEYYSFVNGQHTTQGGTHQSAFKEHIAKTIKEFYGKYEYADIRNGLVAAIAINVEEPVFESQTKIKLDIEIAFTHTNQYGEEYYSFVNGQHTTQGGTHQSAFKEHIAKTIKEFYGKYEYADIRNGLVAAIAINVEEPVFESQTKIKLGSTTMTPNGGETINKYVGDFLNEHRTHHHAQWPPHLEPPWSAGFAER